MLRESRATVKLFWNNVGDIDHGVKRQNARQLVQVPSLYEALNFWLYLPNRDLR